MGQPLRREALVPGEVDARSWNLLCKVLNACTANEPKLALDQHRKEQHAHEGCESDKEVNLQCGDNADKTRNHAQQGPPHTLGRVAVQTLRRHCRGKLLVSTQLVFDLPEDSLFVVRQWHGLIVSLRAAKHKAGRNHFLPSVGRHVTRLPSIGLWAKGILSRTT